MQPSSRSTASCPLTYYEYLFFLMFYLVTLRAPVLFRSRHLFQYFGTRKARVVTHVRGCLYIWDRCARCGESFAAAPCKRIQDECKQKNPSVKYLLNPRSVKKKTIHRIRCAQYHDQRIRHAGNDVEITLECERKVVENPTERVDGHEKKRYADHLLVFVDLVVLRPVVFHD